MTNTINQYAYIRNDDTDFLPEVLYATFGNGESDTRIMSQQELYLSVVGSVTASPTPDPEFYTTAAIDAAYRETTDQIKKLLWTPGILAQRKLGDQTQAAYYAIHDAIKSTLARWQTELENVIRQQFPELDAAYPKLTTTVPESGTERPAAVTVTKGTDSWTLDGIRLDDEQLERYFRTGDTAPIKDNARAEAERGRQTAPDWMQTPEAEHKLYAAVYEAIETAYYNSFSHFCRFLRSKRTDEYAYLAAKLPRQLKLFREYRQAQN